MRPLLLLLLLASSASAEVPLDPYPDCTLPNGACPNDSGNWTLLGTTPDFLQGILRAEEVDDGVGNAILPAFQHSMGSWDRIVAVADSGIDWDERDLRNKVFLNVGELPPPQDADGVETPYDRDGNGLVNLRDYEEDPRVLEDAGAWRADHVLDPSDLIHTFSDGVDDDGNGYVDDIAGWDFFEGDNDPFATTLENYGDHGTGVMKSAAGEGDNGDRIGTCPNCALLPIRIGDSFISTGAIAADGIEFALAHDVSVLGMALGLMTNPPALQEVMASAWDEGLLIVVAAGDENSFHRNGPATNRDNLVAFAMGASNREWEIADSFQRFVNCDNFGPRIDLGAITRTSCATGAVAYITGAAGLLFSLGDEVLDEPLSPGEVFQLLTQTAVDVDIPESRGPTADPELYPSQPGWDSHFGHGRLHLGRAADAVLAGSIPPMAALDTPDWFEVVPRAWTDAEGVDHGGAEELVVAGRISARSAWTARVEWGVGSDPQAWTEFGTLSGDAPHDGELATLAIGQTREREIVVGTGCNPPVDDVLSPPLDDLDPALAATATYETPAFAGSDGVLGRLEKLDGYGMSVRLTVEDADGNVAESRRHLFLREDPRLLPGFPVRAGGSFETSPVLADVDGDGVFEVAVAESGGVVRLLDGTGADLPGWPQDTADRTREDWPAAGAENIGGTVAVGDLDGPTVVAATLDGSVWAWRVDGSVLDGFPVQMDFAHCDPADRTEEVRTDCGFFAAPTLVDLDGDGALDILLPGMDQHLYAWDATGTALPGFPAFVQGDEYADRVNRILSSPAVGDVDGDGDLDIVLGTSQTAGSQFGGYGLLYILEADGSVHDGWPVPLFAGFAGALPYVGEGVVVSPSVADLDGDGDLEIAANATADQSAIYHHDGTEYADFYAIREHFGPHSNSTEQAALHMVGNGAFGDLDGDGSVDWFAGGSGIGYGGAILARHDLFDHDHLLLGYSGALTDDGRSAPLPGFPRQVSDISFFGSPSLGDVDGDGDVEVLFGTGHVLRTFDAEGTEPLAPLFHGGWQISTPALGDIDGDGWRDVLVTTREGYLFAWRTDGRADTDSPWPQWGHDARHTGNFHTEVPTQAGPPEVQPPVEEEDSCEDAAFVLMLPLLFGLRRRSR